MDLSFSDMSTLSSGGRRRSSRPKATPAARRGSLGTSIRSTPADRSSRSTPAVHSSRSTPGERSSRNTPPEIRGHEEHDPTPTKRAGLRPRDHASKVPHSDSMEAAMKPLTDEERRSWPGWVELESDPVSSMFYLRLCKPRLGIKSTRLIQNALGTLQLYTTRVRR